MSLEKRAKESKLSFFGKMKKRAMPYVFATGLGLAVIGCNHSILPEPTSEPTPGPAPDYTTEIESIGKAADRLVETQNNDGGWDWTNPDTDLTSISPKNTVGVTAQGVLDAYKLIGEEAYLDTAIDAYNYMVNLAGLDERMRGPDIPFLVELSEETGNSVYADLAKVRYQDALTDNGGTATGLAEFIRDGRIGQGYPSLISWDINLYVQGALALNRNFQGQGFDEDAQDMTEVIYQSLYGSPPDFDLSNLNQDDYWLSHTGAIEAFTTTNLHLTERNSLVENLVNSQEYEGYFGSIDDGTDVQTTAYAIMSLLRTSRRTPTDDAVDYLTDNQLSNGGWGYDITENTEITSESAQAIFDYIN